MSVRIFVKRRELRNSHGLWRSCLGRGQPRTQGLSSALLTGVNTLVWAGHVTSKQLFYLVGVGPIGPITWSDRASCPG